MAFSIDLEMSFLALRHFRKAVGAKPLLPLLYAATAIDSIYCMLQTPQHFDWAFFSSFLAASDPAFVSVAVAAPVVPVFASDPLTAPAAAFSLSAAAFFTPASSVISPAFVSAQSVAS